MQGSDNSVISVDPLRFSALDEAKPGVLDALLRDAYGQLLATGEAVWQDESVRWAEFDREAFARPEVARCVFLSWCGAAVVGFGSFDPRETPRRGIVGHHCVRPAYRGRGFGDAQLREIIRRLRARGAERLAVNTLDLPFFAPARRLYAHAGFDEVSRRPWSVAPDVMELELELPTGH